MFVFNLIASFTLATQTGHLLAQRSYKLAAFTGLLCVANIICLYTA